MKKRICIFMILFSTFLASCTSFSVSISSISQNNAKPKKVFLAPLDPNINPNDLLFIEFSNDIKLALGKNGFKVVLDPQSADQIVFILYGISDPKTKVVAIPQFGKTKIKSSSTTGNLQIWNNQGTYRATTTYNYDYGVTGYTYYNQIQYTRILTLLAIDYKAYLSNSTIIQVWQTQIESTGSSGDLRLVFPYLVFAAEKFIGKNTGRIIQTEIFENEKGVKIYQEN